MDKRIIIIDGNSLINRAYYAMQKPMITRDGLYTQGVYGFINMLSKIQKDYPSEYIAVAFDLKAPTFRHKEYAEYKAGRKKMPPELAMQMPVIKDVLKAMNIGTLEMEGFEADDIIGTVSLQAEEKGLDSLIITGDKDELQLAGEKTRVLITRKGISNFDLFDREAMIEKYGFTPEQFIDFKGLMGDQSDNIPGLPGVGEKTATKLILEFGSVENLLEKSADIRPEKLRQKVEENAQLAMMSKRLATINRNMPLDVDFDDYRWGEPDRDALIEIYKKLEFNSFLKRMGSETAPKSASQEEEGQVSPEKFEGTDNIKIVKVGTGEEFESMREGIVEGSEVGIKVFGDDNHKAPPTLYGACILHEDTLYYVSFMDEDSLPRLIDVIKSRGLKLSGHNLKRDLYALMSGGYFDPEVGFDTAIAQYVLDSGRSNYNLSAMSNEYLHEAIEEEGEFMDASSQMNLLADYDDDYIRYGLKWCAISRQIAEIQKQKIKEESLEEVCYESELPLIRVMAYMEHTGFAVDKQTLEEMGRGIKSRIETLTAQIHEMAGEDFNVNSPVQLGAILFEKLGLPAGKKTKRGYSTSADILEKIAEEHPIVPLVLEYRMLAKLNGTYIDGLIPLIGVDGRIHAHFNQTVTTTGRISGSDPNLQNIPIRQELGRQLRKAFVSREGYVLIGADYSQIELRVLAHMSGDEALIESFNKGEDIHKATAAKVLGIPEAEITTAQRSRAKAVNFGVIYGMSAFGLSDELKITRKEADKYINDYFEKHPKVKSFMDEQVESCRANGYVETIMGRKRYINEINAKNYMLRQVGERLAMNSPIQGSAADIIKIAMAKVYDKLLGYKSGLILQVHDELLIEASVDELEEVKTILKENMEDAMKLSVTLVTDLNGGKNWYELK